MEFKNKVEVWMEGIVECHLNAFNDCSMGKIYDYACALKAFAIQRMQEEDAKKEEKVDIQPAVE